MADRADLPAKLHPALARIEASPPRPCSEASAAARGGGASYREAATQVGLRSTADLRRHARTFGLLEIHKRAAARREADTEEIETRTLIAGLKRLARLASRELQRRLESEPIKIQTRDLTVLAGVAADKVRDFENWRSGATPEANGAGQQALEALFRASRAGAPLHVTVTEVSLGEHAPAPGGAHSPMREDRAREQGS